MYSISVIFGPSGNSFRFLFRQEEDARKYLNSATPMQDLIISDDFGQHGEFKAPQVHGIVFEDMKLTLLAAVEMGLQQARVQAKAQEVAKTDPMLRAAMRGNSPGVLTPHFPQ